MNGEECLNLINEKRKKNLFYKLILMDVIMPVLGGIDASKKIQEMVNNKMIKNDINIVFLSASVDQKSIILELKKNFPIIKEFLLKPVKFTKIEEIVKKFYKK
jgi:CheY-like chemotaxis protein